MKNYQIFSNLQDKQVVIFDYDSTIAKVPVDWQKGRVHYRSYLEKIFSGLVLPEDARVDEMEALALQHYPDEKNRVFQYRMELESALDGGHIALQETCQLIGLLQRLHHHRLFIISNNLRRTVVSGLQQLGLSDAFEAILGVDDVGLPKPETRGFSMLQASHDLKAEDCIFIGDNDRTDGGFCRALGIPFVNIRQK